MLYVSQKFILVFLHKSSIECLMHIAAFMEKERYSVSVVLPL